MSYLTQNRSLSSQPQEIYKEVSKQMTNIPPESKNKLRHITALEPVRAVAMVL